MLAARRIRPSRVSIPPPLRHASLTLSSASTATQHTYPLVPSPAASSSRQPYGSLSYRGIIDVKGKGRACEDFGNPNSILLSVSARLQGQISRNDRNDPQRTRFPLHAPFFSSSRRSFHSSARRDAIPLIPGTIVILKGTSILTAATVFSRVFISFFPIGTLAAFKMARAGRWIETDVVRPSVSPEAEEFWKMWCEGEKEIRLTRTEAMKYVNSEPDDNGALVAEDGRMAWPIPMPPRPGWAKQSGPENRPFTPKDMMVHFKGNRNRTANVIQRTSFYTPDLPPASIRFYQELPPATREEVESLRRYWLGLKAFKDHFQFARGLVGFLFWFPFLLLTVVYLAGLERVPLTGRWRLILLTPEEEDAVSTSLAGPNWYRSVINLLTTAEKAAPPIVPPNDWRWAWAQTVLTRLENAALSDCPHLPKSQRPDKQNPLALTVPPPAYHPLKPRPRVSSWLHSCLPGGEPSSGREHLEIGPPYNLMLMEKDERNAFSYGFGGKRAGGIVVFTGLLESILRDIPSAGENEPTTATPSKGFFSNLFSSPSPPKRIPVQPTEEQTLHLACVLAHEMGHLLLSHHVETLSQQQVLWPSILGLTMDLVRAFIWPFTVFLGPAVNDALANMGRTSTDELIDKYGEVGFQWVHEYEADLAGVRILALAGFDPQAALKHFENSVADLHEIQPIDKADSTWTGSLFKLWSRGTHPSSEKRVTAIQEELKRWDKVASERQVGEVK